MEENLSKKDIMYLYLNQIYLGHSAHGVAMASQIYFRKPVIELTLAEMAILAGLPQAPSRYSPVFHPDLAKRRQLYVLERMTEDGYIDEETHKKTAEEPVTVYLREDYQKTAPYYIETVRQILVGELGENTVLDKGLKVYTGLDYKKQLAAQEAMKLGLRELDKRQGFRGPLNKLTTPEQIAIFLKETREKLVFDSSPVRVVLPDGSVPQLPEMSFDLETNEAGEKIAKLPSYMPIGTTAPGVVTKIDDKWGLVTVSIAETQGFIDLDTMKWARKPNPEVKSEHDELKKPSAALAVGDVIEVKIVDKRFNSQRLKEKIDELKVAHNQKTKKQNPKPVFELPVDLPKFQEYIEVELEQEPEAEGSLISFGQGSADIVAMVGGQNYAKSQFNRAIQALRQTGSAFKAIVYAAALDGGFSPVSKIIDAPVVYEEHKIIDEGQQSEEVVTKRWKPENHSKSFGGDILFRNALIQSKNVPTVKIVQDLGVNWVASYARKLGMFSPLNMDFTLGLGSSAVTLYELTKVFSTFGRMGTRIRPVVIHKVMDRQGTEIMGVRTLDDRFKEQIEPIETELEKRRQTFLTGEEAKLKELANSTIAEKNIAEGTGENQNKEVPPNTGQKTRDKIPKIYFKDPDQLINSSTAFLITNLLEGTITDRLGTGSAARSIGRPAAGKTGTTNGYYDAWFVGYTPQIVTGVWVGYDTEKTLGRGEVGGRAALPIWLDYMKQAHIGLPETSFPVPPEIVFANIDNATGNLAGSNSKEVVKQAFLQGTEPKSLEGSDNDEQDSRFFKQDMSE